MVEGREKDKKKRERGENGRKVVNRVRNEERETKKDREMEK